MREKKSNSQGKKNFRGKRNSADSRKSNSNFKSSKPSSGRGRSRGRGKGKSNRKIQSIPVDKMIHKGIPVEESAFEPTHTFEQYPFDSRLKENLKNLGYTNPTEIQERAIEPIAMMKNVMGIANTGTGKTAAFLLPLINAMLDSENKFSVLVIVPTRELAQQVEEEFRNLTKGLKLYATCVIGGQSINTDLKKLSRPNHFIIGTPGRLVDLTKRNAIKYDDFSVLVLDEFDRMLDMGFSKDVDFLTKKMVYRDQTLLFSATIDESQQSIINGLMNDYITIKVSSGTKTAEHIDQEVIYSSHKNKFDILLGMLREDDFEKVIVFAETKRHVSNLALQLKRSHVRVDEIHGDKTQGYRKRALETFKRGKINVLVATDVAARGLDINNVSHVINYTQPNDYETYIHRIGRTGRAGKVGKAFTFVDEKLN